MLAALTAIFLCQLAGETLVVATGLPIPGPVFGMVILFVFFVVNGGIPASIATIGDGLLGHLSILFVPAGVGILQHGARLEAEGLQIGATLIASTILTIGVTGLVMRLLGRSEPKGEASDNG